MTTFYTFIRFFCELLSFLIILRAIFSWFPISFNNPLLVILNQITEPVLAPLRRIIPRLGAIDITPLVAIVILQVIAGLIPG